MAYNTELGIYQIKEVWDRHKELARLAALGWRNKDIALRLGMTESSVSLLKNNPMIREIIDFLSSRRDEKATEVVQTAQEFAQDSIALLAETVQFRPGRKDMHTGNIPSMNDQIRSAIAILDISTKTLNNPRVNPGDDIISAEVIEEVKRRALEEMKSTANPAVIVEESEESGESGKIQGVNALLPNAYNQKG